MQEKESKTNWHFYISLAKSFLRFGAGFALIFGKLAVSGVPSSFGPNGPITNNIFIGTQKVDTVVSESIKRTGTFTRGR